MFVTNVIKINGLLCADKMNSYIIKERRGRNVCIQNPEQVLIQKSKPQHRGTTCILCTYWIHSLLVLCSANNWSQCGRMNLEGRINQPGVLHVCIHNSGASEVELTAKWKPYFREPQATRGRFKSVKDVVDGGSGKCSLSACGVFRGHLWD